MDKYWLIIKRSGWILDKWRSFIYEEKYRGKDNFIDMAFNMHPRGCSCKSCLIITGASIEAKGRNFVIFAAVFIVPSFAIICFL
jgi:hypothetical protein